MVRQMIIDTVSRVCRGNPRVPDDVEGKRGVFGVALQKELEELIEILGYLLLRDGVVPDGVSIRKTGTNRLINLHRSKKKGG